MPCVSARACIYKHLLCEEKCSEVRCGAVRCGECSAVSAVAAVQD